MPPGCNVLNYAKSFLNDMLYWHIPLSGDAYRIVRLLLSLKKKQKWYKLCGRLKLLDSILKNHSLNMVKLKKNSRHPKTACNFPKLWKTWFYHTVVCTNDADGITIISVNPTGARKCRFTWGGVRRVSCMTVLSSFHVSFCQPFRRQHMREEPNWTFHAWKNVVIFA